MRKRADGKNQKFDKTNNTCDGSKKLIGTLASILDFYKYCVPSKSCWWEPLARAISIAIEDALTSLSLLSHLKWCIFSNNNTLKINTCILANHSYYSLDSWDIPKNMIL